MPATALPPFQSLIDAHAGELLRFLRGMVGADEADDCLQETLIAALRAYPGFDGANPRAWLLTIARNKATDAHRARARRPEPLEQPDLRPSPVAVPGGSRAEEIWAEVAALPPKQRAALVLRFATDLRYREVAAVIGCSEEAARRSVHEGLSKLRETRGVAA
jgi:RNA polymerase sigma factor (sigma-70 family)